MSRLVTQAVSEQPVVALVGAASPLRSVLVSFFERHDFAVAEFSSPTDFSKQNAQFYKILVLEGWSREILSKQLDLNTNDYIDALIKAQKSSNSVFFIQKHVSITQSDFEYERKTLRFTIETNQPQVNIVLGQDVLFDTSVWWVWQIITSKLASSMFVDPNCLLYPISFKSFIRLLTPLILSPQTELRSVIRGQEQPSKYVVAEIVRQYDLYHQKKLRVIEEKVSLDESHEKSFSILETPREALPTLLQEGVQSLPSPQRLATSKNAESPLQKPQNKEYKKHPVPPEKPTIPSNQVEKNKEFRPSTSMQPVVRQKVIPVNIEQEPITAPDTTKEKNEPTQKQTVDEQLSALFSKNRTKTKVEKITKKVHSTKQITQKNKKRSALFLGGMGVVGAALGALFLASFFWLNQVMLRKTVFAQIEQPTDSSSQTLVVLRQILQLQTDSYEAFLPAPFFDSAHEILALSDDWVKAQERITAFNSVQIDLLQQLVGNQLTAPLPPADQVAYEEISRLYSRFDSLLDEDIDPSDKESIQDIARSLEQQRSAFVTYQQLSPLLPTLIGQQEKRTYAILLQNNQEIRATGGFLSAVALVTLDQGQIIDTQVFSSYELDESLSAVITPPEDLKRVLGEERLYLRDANWNPDFPTAARQIREILREQLNKNIDGVIGINTLVLEDLLRATGPLELDEYNELLTDRNIAERLEFHSEVTLVESDQSSDYSAVVLERLLGKITTLSREKTPEFLSTVREQLAHKNILVSFTDSNELATFSLLGWTGEIVKPNCPAQFSSEQCIVDTLAVIDSNVGVNKANYHTQRSESHQVRLTPNQAIHTHNITFKNTSQSNAWPKGTYQSYLRLILPTTAKLQTISINETPLSSDDIFVSNLGEFAMVGFSSSTPIQSSTKITIKYETPHQLEVGDSYTLFIQKQPGINQPLSSVDVDLNSSFRPALIAPQAEVINEIISFKDINKGHMFLGIGVK